MSRLPLTALDAVLHIGQLYPRVANGRTAMRVQPIGILTDVSRDGDRITEQQALVTVDVANDLHIWVLGVVLLDEGTDRRGEAGSEASGSEHGHLLRRRASW